jgi:hypothetical protein
MIVLREKRADAGKIAQFRIPVDLENPDEHGEIDEICLLWIEMRHAGIITAEGSKSSIPVRDWSLPGASKRTGAGSPSSGRVLR